MKINRFLFLLCPIISCTIEEPPAFVTVTNNNEYDIFWVAIVDTRTGYPVVSERHDKLIEKGNSKTFKIESEELAGDFTVCVKTENTSEFICTVKFTLYGDDKKSFIYREDSSLR